jgi:hypothetical protein
MDDDEFNLFADSAVGELQAKQHFLHVKYRFGLSARWEFDANAATLKFFDKNDGLHLSCSIIEVGTFSVETLTWKWAWSNRWLPPKLRERAIPLKQLQGVTGREFFGSEAAPFSADQAMARKLAAISVRHLSSLGCYKAAVRDGRLHAFLALDSIDAVSV